MNFAYDQKDIADFYNTYQELIFFGKIFPKIFIRLNMKN